jgi:protein-L-isoaspartate(D-aspartate) O-methyltransferase
VTSSAVEFKGPRRRLVETLREKGITDLAVLHAVERTPRHLFVPTGVAHRAYEDAALPIGSGQTISQPLIHARTLQALALAPCDRVLEIGTGSGYQTVLLAHLAAQVFSVERIAVLMERAREAIRASEVHNVSLLVGDGTLGWPTHAPYDAIVVSAASPEVPAPLLAQLADGGRLAVPVGSEAAQALRLVRRRGESFVEEDLGPVRFVPLVGEHGWER